MSKIHKIEIPKQFIYFSIFFLINFYKEKFLKIWTFGVRNKYALLSIPSPLIFFFSFCGK